MKKICIISDTHFSANNDLLFSKIDVEKNLLIIINKLLVEKPDYLFILGDISQDGSIKSYQKIKLFLDRIDCCKYVLMGNHDSENIQYILSENIIMPDYLDIDNHRFIFISSYRGNNLDDGYVKEEEFNKILSLATIPNKLNYLLIHHHFIKTGGIIDNWIMINHNLFLENIKANNIIAVFHGHVHHGYTKKIKNTYIYAAPSTCVQFALKPELILEPSIGYQIVYLTKDKYDHETIII